MSGEATARFYDEAHDRIVELVRSLTADEVRTPVPATPGWTVHDVLAHLAAIPTDALAGRLTGMPTDEFTAGQIQQRREASVDELVAEWAGNVAAMCDGARAGLLPPNLAVDAVTHEQDIRGAVGRGRVPDAAAVRFCLELYATGVSHRIRRAGAPALRISATDSEFTVVAGEGHPAAAVRADEFELFRATSGRRGRAEVAGLQWEGDASPYLDCLNVFGPVPDDALSD